MKKCPLCNRTYSDETLSFCLEDGQLLSAPFNLREEQETVVRPQITKPAVAEHLTPSTHKYTEIPTTVSAKNAGQTLTRTPKTQSNVRKIVYLFFFGFLIASVYTQSVIPLINGLVLLLIYLGWSFIKRKER
jgi:hypothetical protein